MEYRLPALEDEKIIGEYLDEHFAAGEDSVLYNQDMLLRDFPGWVQLIHSNADKGNGDWGRSLLYLCFDGGALIGILTLRYELTPELEAIYGHIGYVVRPSQRNKGYATRMLMHGLDECRELGLESVTLGCYKANAPSGAVIRKCGGILVAENDNYTAGVTSQYYAIPLKG